MRLNFLILILCLSSATYSQDVNIPVSPNVASMGEYGSFPIGYHTGTPLIEFPFFEINLDGLIIPIKLKYNSSGIRIDQEAGWVGLGWSLEAGGCITKEVRGYNDFNYDDSTSPGGVSSGYYYTQRSNYNQFLYKINYNPVTEIIEATQGEELLTSEASYLSGQDNEPDLYHFNFCNYSGTFYFEPRKNNDPISDNIKPVIKSSNQYLDITYNITENKWLIIDQQGYKFTFERNEFTHTYAEQTEYKTPILSTDKSRLNLRKKGASTDTNCLLKSIESPKGRKVSFTYNHENLSTPINTSYQSDIPIYIEGSGNIIIGGGGNKSYTYTYSGIEQLLPATISFDGGSISFLTSDRKDIERFVNLYRVRPGISSLAPQKLDQVLIKDHLGNNVKNIKLSYSYMGDTTDVKLSRLMLNSFEVTDAQEQKKQLYKFTYKEGVLPAKNSYNSDIWGFYNGTVNQAQLPTYTELKSQGNINNSRNYPESHIREGANRLTNEKYMQYGALDMIEYPTGGKTRLLYEAHDFKNGSNSGFLKKILLNANVSYSPDNSSQQNSEYTYSKDFILENDSYIRLSFHYHIYDSYKPVLSRASRIFLQEKHGNNYIDIYNKVINLEKPNESINLDEDAIYLKKGTYRIYLWREAKDQNGQNKSFNYFISASATSFVWHSESKGGGLRIKEIQNIDNGNIVSKKRYSYSENGHSSGCLLSIPDYNFLQTLDRTIMNSVVYYESIRSMMQKYMSYNKQFIPSFGTPFIPNNGAAAQVCYKYVEESSVDMDDNTTGKTTYRYLAEPSKTKIPFPIPKDYHIGNGSLLEEAQYDNDGVLQKKKKFNYSFKSIPEATTLYIPKFYAPSEPHMIGIQFYEIKPEYWELDSISESDYFELGKKEVNKQTIFKYNMDNRLISEKTEKLGRNNFVTHTKYAKDLSDQTALKMKDKNMIGIPLETITLKDSKIISGNKSQYTYVENRDVMLMKNSYSLKKIPNLSLTDNYSQYYEVDYTIINYDNYGNPVEIEKIDGTHDVYLWSYNGQHLVAEIKNATYSTVNIALASVGLTSINTLSANTNPDKSKLDKLRSQSTLSNAHISTYLYKPLVGLIQMTNPSGVTSYYEYDSLGRLIRARDMNHNIIQEYDYHHKNQ